MATLQTDPNNANLYSDVFPSFAPAVPFGGVAAEEKKGSSDIKSSLAQKWHEKTALLELFADFVLSNIAVTLAYLIYHNLHIGKLAHFKALDIEVAATVIAVFYVMVLKLSGAYSRATSLLRVRETERVIAASTQLCFVVFAVGFWAELPLPRLIVFFATFLIPALVLSGKHLIYKLSCSVMANEDFGRRTIIYGAGLSGVRVYSLLARSPKLGLDPIAIVDDDVKVIGKTVQESGYTSSRQTEVLAGPITAEMLRQMSAEVLIVTTASITVESSQQIGIACTKAGVALSVVPHDTMFSGRSLSYWDADGVIFASVEEKKPNNAYAFAKRVFDFSIAALLLSLFSPVLFAIILAIRLTSQGPALFIQERVGKDGRIFKMNKFRTMYVTGPKYAYSPISCRDLRITKIGAFLRRTSLDELPQLLNVLKGDMSLVGPRPEMPFIVEQYHEIHRQRLQVLPGITGLWQISAGRAQLIHENIQYDLYYIRNQRFFMDLAILLHTILFAMRGI